MDFKAIGLIYKKPKYWMFTIGLALIIFVALNLFSNSSLLINSLTGSETFDYKLALFKNLIIGTFYTLTTQSILTQSTLLLLVGMNFSMMHYKMKELNSSATTASGIIGSVLGILTAGCSACGFGLLPYLGIAGVLAALPFHGLEIWFLGVILLIYSLHVTSEKIGDACPFR